MISTEQPICHTRVGGYPLLVKNWIPVFTGMTKGILIQSKNAIDITEHLFILKM